MKRTIDDLQLFITRKYNKDELTATQVGFLNKLLNEFEDLVEEKEKWIKIIFVS